MGAATYTVEDHGEDRQYKWLVLRVASATAADEVTVAQLSDIAHNYCIRLDTLAEVTNTEATNVITIGTGPSSTALLIFVYGYKT